MASVTGYTAERMLEIENSTVVDGEVVDGNLNLIRRDGTVIDAGNVQGPIGATGPAVTIPSVATARLVFAGETVQSIANNFTTAINWATEEYDALGFHSTTTNTSRLTVPAGQAGVYIVSFSLYFAAASANIASAWIQKNVSTNRYGFTQMKHDSVNGIGLHSSEPMNLDVGDYVQVMAFQNAGSAVNAGNTTLLSGLSSFSLARIGPL